VQILSVVPTFGAAALGSLLYLAHRQRPQHRPFDRHGWRYTIVAATWVAAVTTVATYAVTMVSSFPIPSPVLAFAAPIGAGGMHAVGQRVRAEAATQQANESTPFQQLLTLGLPLMTDWLDDRLADLKHQRIDSWHARIRTHYAVRALIKRFQARLEERSLPSTAAILRRLGEREELYTELYEDWLRSDGYMKRRLKVDLNVAVEDILRLVYEARADVLLQDATY
jgi:hypothetical protein